MNYLLRVNHKKKSSTVRVTVDERDQQFNYIQDQRQLFAQDTSPTISVDTKKKESIGNFKNDGKTWCDQPIIVKDHDFQSESDGIAIPYGIYSINKLILHFFARHLLFRILSLKFAACCAGKYC